MFSLWETTYNPKYTVFERKILLGTVPWRELGVQLTMLNSTIGKGGQCGCAWDEPTSSSNPGSFLIFRRKPMLLPLVSEEGKGSLGNATNGMKSCLQF